MNELQAIAREDQMEALRAEFSRLWGAALLENSDFIEKMQPFATEVDIALWRQMAWTVFKKARGL